MRTDSEWSPGPGVKVSATNRTDGGWMVSAIMSGGARCPACGTQSSRRHGWYVRHLQDLPAQGAAVKLMLRVIRWRCLNPSCAQKTFGHRLPQMAPYGRRTRRVVDLARLLAHTAGGRPAGRLMTRLRVPQSKDTLLRSLKRGVNKQAPAAPVRVLSVDDWSWRKGSTYGTIMVDLERHEVLDGLPDRSAESTASWLACRPTVKIVSRDRCGLYAQGAAQGAPQATQVADWFHLLQNLRQTIEQQLTRAPSRQLQIAPQEIVVLQEPPSLIHHYGQPEVTEHRHLVRAGRRGRSQLGFDRVKALHDEGNTLAQIARETGFNWRTVRKWTRLDAFRPQATMAPKPTAPGGFGRAPRGIFDRHSPALPGSIGPHQTPPARLPNRAPSFPSACPGSLIPVTQRFEKSPIRESVK